MAALAAIAIAVLAVFAPFRQALAVEPFPGETTWESPPVSTQLLMDDTIIPVGKGAIFCPVMTQEEDEPPYGIIRNGSRVDDALMGTRIVLAPGTYDVVLGSGTIDQMIRRRVRVEESATTLIKPEWSGLVVEVINDSRASVRESYEILDTTSGRSYGLGQGVSEDLDEQLRTWILPPGLYKLVKPGDNLNAVVNFGTVRLLAGELVRTHLVIDEESGAFVGFGQVLDVRQSARSRRLGPWVSRTEISGNMLLNYTPASQAGGASEAGLAASVQLLSDARYQSGRHIIPIWANLEEGLSVNRDREVSKFADKGELKVTYIYRLRRWFSPYLRGAVETRFFPTEHRFGDPTDYVELNAKGDTVRSVQAADEIRLANSFSPINLKRGAGVTATLVQTIPMNFIVRGGYGARQSFRRGALAFDPVSRTLSPLPEVDITGMELLTLADVRLGRYIVFDSEFDMLMPASDSDTWLYDSDNRFRINLTRHVNVVLQFEFWRHEDSMDVQTRLQALLRFSKNL